MLRNRLLSESSANTDTDIDAASNHSNSLSKESDILENVEPDLRLLSGHKRRGRIAIKAIVGGAWLLGIGVALAAIVVAIALALSNPISLLILGIAASVGIGLPGVFMIVPHVRDYFLKTLDKIAKWFIPDPQNPELQSEFESESESEAKRVSSVGDKLEKSEDCFIPIPQKLASPLSFINPKAFVPETLIEGPVVDKGLSQSIV